MDTVVTVPQAMDTVNLATVLAATASLVMDTVNLATVLAATANHFFYRMRKKQTREPSWKHEAVTISCMKCNNSSLEMISTGNALFPLYSRDPKKNNYCLALAAFLCAC